MKSISYNLFISVASRLLVGVFGLFVVGILTRSLGLVGYGYYNAILAYLFLFSTLADFGLYTILIREISKAGSDETHITNSLFTLRLVIVLVSAVIADVIALRLPYPHEVKIALIFASIYLVTSSLVQILNAIFQKHLRVSALGLSDIVSRLAQLAVLLVMVRQHHSLFDFIVVMVASEVIRLVIVLVATRSIIPLRLTVDWSHWRTSLRQALPIATSLIFVILYFKLDTFMLSLMKPAHDVGVYSLGYKLLETIIFLPATYIGLVMPFLSRYATNKRHFQQVFNRAFQFLAVLAFPTAVYLYFLATQIITILGGRGALESVIVLQILTIAIVAIFFGNLAGQSVIALNLQSKAVIVYLFGAVLNIVSNLIFIPHYSYIAASWNTVITEIFITFSLFFLIRRSFQISKPLIILIKCLIAGALMALVVAATASHFVLAILAGLIYFPILLLLGGFTLQDLKTFLNHEHQPLVYEEIVE